MIDSSLIWNIRGIGNPASVRSLVNHVKDYKVKIVAVLEPKIPLDRAGKIARRIQLKGFVGNDGIASKIWLFWHEDMKVDIVRCNSQFITVALNMEDKSVVYLTAVYASCNMLIRRELFDTLTLFSNNIVDP